MFQLASCTPFFSSLSGKLGASKLVSGVSDAVANAGSKLGLNSASTSDDSKSATSSDTATGVLNKLKEAGSKLKTQVQDGAKKAGEKLKSLTGSTATRSILDNASEVFGKLKEAGTKLKTQLDSDKVKNLAEKAKSQLGSLKKLFG